MNIENKPMGNILKEWKRCCIAALLVIGTGGVLGAATKPCCPHPGGRVCISNNETFGYYQTTWRPWPTAKPPQPPKAKKTIRKIIPAKEFETPTPVEEVEGIVPQDLPPKLPVELDVAPELPPELRNKQPLPLRWDVPPVLPRDEESSREEIPLEDNSMKRVDSTDFSWKSLQPVEFKFISKVRRASYHRREPLEQSSFNRPPRANPLR